MLGQASNLQVGGEQATSTRDAGSSRATKLSMMCFGFGCFAMGVFSACLVLPRASEEPVHYLSAVAAGDTMFNPPLVVPLQQKIAADPQIKPPSSFRPRVGRTSIATHATAAAEAAAAAAEPPPMKAGDLPPDGWTPRGPMTVTLERYAELGEDYIDPYVVLGVPKTATAADIKTVYRKLSRMYHPDVNPEKNAQEKFMLISRAYAVLGDAEERRKFDFSGRLGLAPDFAERVSGFREAAGPEYNRVAEKAERLIENKWAVVAFSTFMPIVLLTVTTLAKDWLRELVLGPR